MATIFGIHSVKNPYLLYCLLSDLVKNGLKSTDWNRRYTGERSTRRPRHICVRNGCAFLFLVEPSQCDVHFDLTEEKYTAILQEILDNQ